VTAAHMRLKSAFRQESSPLSWNFLAPAYRSWLCGARQSAPAAGC